MKDRTMMRVGIGGTVVALICCFTPVLVWGLAVVGIAAGIWLDMILIPAVLVFAAIGLYGWSRARRAARPQEEAPE